MTRAPFNVAVYPYRRVGDDFYYALLKRSDAGYWQGVAGGGEDDETPLEAAKREASEEAGILPDALFLQLDTVESIRVTEFGCSHLWGEDVYVIPQYWFGVLVQHVKLTLSREHTGYQWLAFKEAHDLVRYDGDKTALWELDRRLRGRGPRG